MNVRTKTQDLKYKELSVALPVEYVLNYDTWFSFRKTLQTLRFLSGLGTTMSHDGGYAVNMVLHMLNIFDG